MKVRKFKFTINNEDYHFSCKEEDILRTIKKNFPNAELRENYCTCTTTCSCKNGHFITMAFWKSEIILWPSWGESRDYYHSRLQVGEIINNEIVYENYYNIPCFK